MIYGVGFGNYGGYSGYTAPTPVRTGTAGVFRAEARLPKEGRYLLTP